MDVSFELSANKAENKPVLRAQSNPTVVQATLQAVNKDTLEYIAQAIKDGDNLPNSTASLEAKVLRRALIVAPQYEVHLTNYIQLPATLNDVSRIHKMLTQRGYDRANIRILVDGLTDPTSDNIIKSLEWLVSEAQPGDYRFFHFSGHGTHILSTKKEGKEALRIPEKRSASLPHDHELSHSSNRSTQFKRVKSLDVDNREIAYYNEAIVTSYKPLPLIDSLSKDVREYNLIRDSVLNAYFAKLPKQCKLTCTLDCCHSGRMINNNFKLAGAGFRGKCTYSDASGHKPTEPSGTFTRKDDFIEQLNNKQTVKEFSLPGGYPALDDALDPPDSPIYEEPISLPVVQTATQPSSPSLFSRLIQNFFSPPLISKLKELLPAEEASRDKIKADMLTWAGCHQRQGAIDHNDMRGGLFTWSFTETVLASKGSVTIGKLIYAYIVSESLGKLALIMELKKLQKGFQI
ncbi:Ca(2+)-dependent cysteine protease [Ceratobasidium sp. 392]|nr:Ca(2+)-dependent cysteine protease [Ceratobasidium sp. 392]